MIQNVWVTGWQRKIQMSCQNLSLTTYCRKQQQNTILINWLKIEKTEMTVVWIWTSLTTYYVKQCNVIQQLMQRCTNCDSSARVWLNDDTKCLRVIGGMPILMYADTCKRRALSQCQTYISNNTELAMLCRVRSIQVDSAHLLNSM